MQQMTRRRCLFDHGRILLRHTIQLADP
jgi:hypothetical protein